MAADLRRQQEYAIKRLQALFRGHVVREKLKEVHKEFEKIVHELDGPDCVVVWPSEKQTLTMPLLTMNDLDKPVRCDSEPLPGNVDKIIEPDDLPGCKEKDQTIIQKVYDKIQDISTAQQSTAIGQHEQLPDDPHDSVKQTLEQQFAELSPHEEEQTVYPVKSTLEDLVDNQFKEEERSEKTSSSPCHFDRDKQVYTQHSTPVSSGDSDQSNRGMRRHPLLTDSWMTDKSFDAVCDEAQFTNKELQQRREQVTMELLWTQQAIESRKNVKKGHSK